MKTEIRPTIIVDTREQTPLAFKNLPSEVGTLQSGDYSVRGATELFAVERKSISDLVGCITGSDRERFERELHRLRGFWFSRLLIVGAEAEILTMQYRSNIKPKSVLHSLWAFEQRYRVPVVFEPFADKAALLVERWAYFFARELLKIDQTQFTEPETHTTQ